MTKEDDIIMKPSSPKVGHGAPGYDPTIMHNSNVSIAFKTSISRFQINQIQISYILKTSWVEQKPKINGGGGGCPSWIFFEKIISVCPAY